MGSVYSYLCSDVSPPSKSIHDDESVTEWVESLNTTISLCKIAARVIKFNYSPPPPFEMPSPVKVNINVNCFPSPPFSSLLLSKRKTLLIILET